MAPEWIIIADDLTGACDTGATFASAGISTHVLLDASRPLPPEPGRAWVITTESRHLPEREAVRAVERVVEQLRPAPECRIYKKIDSTLRGHPAVELAAVMRSLGIDRALATPAFPAQGRVVKSGQVWVRGVSLEESAPGQAFPTGSLQPLLGISPGSRLLSLDEVRGGSSNLLDRLLCASGGVIVAEAETDADLQALAGAGQQAGFRLYCGSAGLARALVGPPQSAQPRPVRRPGPVLVVAGSRNLVTLGQVEVARREGIPVVSPGLEEIRAAPAGYRPLERALAQAHAALITTAGLPLFAGEERALAEGLAGLAVGAVAQGALAGLVLTGGDIAAAVCRAAGCPAIRLGGEIQPGLVWGWFEGGRWNGLPLVTKAGGFGGEDALIAAVRFLQGR